MAYARQDCESCGIFNAAIGSNFYGLKNFDSALYYLHKGLSYGESFGEGMDITNDRENTGSSGNDSLADELLSFKALKAYSNAGVQEI